MINISSQSNIIGATNDETEQKRLINVWRPFLKFMDKQQHWCHKCLYHITALITTAAQRQQKHVLRSNYKNCLRIAMLRAPLLRATGAASAKSAPIARLATPAEGA
jgi:hypothetical protein